MTQNLANTKWKAAGKHYSIQYNNRSVCHQPLEIPATKAAVELKCLGQVNFFRKVLGSFRHLESANFKWVPIRKFLWWVRKSQFRRFLQNAAQLCLKTVLKVLFLNDLWSCTILNLSIICHICKKKKYVFAYLRKSENHKKDWIRKSQIRKVPHLRKVRKSNKSFKTANLWSCDVRKS